MKQAISSLLEMLRSSTPDLSFHVRFWDGDTRVFGCDHPAFTLTFRSARAARRLISDGVLGFGEEYMAGAIDVDGSFPDVMRLGLSSSFPEIKLSLLTGLQEAWRRLMSRDTVRRSQKNISHHYDRGNEFFSLWLDASMTYSCAYFGRDGDSLEQAQNQKHEHICRKLLLKHGETLLDIGCGWGAMLIYASRNYGVKGVGCTLSKPQCEYAQQRIEREGLQDSVRIELTDYRQLEGRYDKVVSVGMFEHVGKQYIPSFMRKVQSLLKPGGVGLLHAIGKERESTLNSWTLKYIFPGGYIPALHETLRELATAGMESLDVENLRLHYAKTLDLWSERFEKNVGAVRSMFDERFVRMWRLFLNGSSAGFRYGDSRLYQIVFSNGLNNALPITREHVYRESYDHDASRRLDSTEVSERVSARVLS